jgi:putative intracellular protease/amidase
MPSAPAYDTPSRVYAVHGEVVLDGPDGLGLSMTPDAAAETARRLAKAAEEARHQPPLADDDENELPEV